MSQVPAFLMRKVLTQIFSYINVQLFNRHVTIQILFLLHVALYSSICGSRGDRFVLCSSLLLRRECCSFSNGEYVKAGLAELERWVYEASEDVIGIYAMSFFGYNAF